jgi:sarcosine oxidase
MPGTSSSTYDAIVVGVGGMGSAALYHLTRRGARRVLGLERFEIPNDKGSSHGLSRMIRLAYWEHPSYVPLVRHARELWRDLENEVGEPLLVTTGSIDAGPTDSSPVAGAIRACQMFDLPHVMYDGTSLRKQFPGYQLPDHFVALYQPQGGFLLPERCITAHVTAARRAGADVRAGEPVRDWNDRGDSVDVRTDRGTYSCRQLIVTVGAWTGKLPTGLQSVLTPERQVMIWIQPRRPEYFQPATFPVVYLHAPEGSFYGLPAHDGAGFKFGKYHHLGQDVDPDTMDRECHDEDERVLRESVQRYFPDACGPTLAMKTCIFTNTSDEHFVITRLAHSPITVAAGFSGHGFKFCSVVGEILAELALDGATRHDISLFAPNRLRVVSGAGGVRQ